MTKKSATIFVFLFFFCGLNLPRSRAAEFQLTSPDFKPNQFIPVKFSCKGADINPQLDISGVPAQTRSLALIMDDPDAPMGTWVHWLVYNIAVTSSIPQNSAPGKLGQNSFNRGEYGGPCPPSGTHRYFFKIYALDRQLEFKTRPAKKELEDAMQGHILDRAELIGLFTKGN